MGVDVNDLALVTFQQSHKGAVRTLNEDALMALPQQQVWAVADGMGGYEAGEIASQMVVDELQQVGESADGRSSYVAQLRTAIEQANRRVLQFSQRQLNGETAGSTLVLMYIAERQCHCLWVGDSRLYRYRHGELTQLSSDHSQVNEMVKQGLISATEAESHPLANVVTRAVGVVEPVEVDYVSDTVIAGDRYLLCSDGLTKELPDPLLARCLQGSHVNEAGQALMHAALVSGARDNVTCIVVEVAGATPTPKEESTIPLFSGM